MTFFHKIKVAEKNNFSANTYHNFANGKVISICKYENGGLELCMCIYNVQLNE